jgi:hypothetical protein
LGNLDKACVENSLTLYTALPKSKTIFNKQQKILKNVLKKYPVTVLQDKSNAWPGNITDCMVVAAVTKPRTDIPLP